MLILQFIDEYLHIPFLEGYRDGYEALLLVEGFSIYRQKELDGRKVKTTYGITQRGPDVFRDFRYSMMNLLA